MNTSDSTRPTTSGDLGFDAAGGNRGHGPDRLRRVMSIPSGHVGEYVIPGTGRHIWWTGRVAIGLLYRPPTNGTTAQSAVWIQDLLLAKDGSAARH